MEAACPYVVVDGFFAGARALRSKFEARFAEHVEPFEPSRFVWEYWHVPGQFAQHRAPARAIVGDHAMALFEARLLAWAARSLGLSALGGPPWLSFLLHGDFQALHRDTPNGSVAFTFGLTRPGPRPPYQGGETLFARPELLDYWRRSGCDAERAADPLLFVIPSRYNRLVAFDARVPHAVRAVEGPRDPCDARIAIQGWLQPNGCVVRGALNRAEADALVGTALKSLRATVVSATGGLLSVRLEIAASGRVKRTTVVTDTLVASGGDGAAPERTRSAVVERLEAMRFPVRAHPSSLGVPISIFEGRARLEHAAPA